MYYILLIGSYANFTNAQIYEYQRLLNNNSPFILSV